MQINMRKILAMLSVLAMLCTLLPLSVFAADVNIAIPNGDFESSDLSAWKIGGGRLSTTTAHGGSQSLYSADNLTAYAYSGYVPNIEVAPNSDYTVEFWFCYEATAAKTMRLYVADGGGSATTVVKAANGGSQPVAYCSDSTAGDGVWKKAHLTFNSGDQSTICLKFGGGSGGYNACYIDDIVMIGPDPSEGGDEPSTPDAENANNLVANGYFNDGTATGWTLKEGVVEAYNGDYMLKATSTDKYSSVAKQTISVEADTDYTLDVNALYVGAATKATARVHVYAGTSSTDLVSTYYWTITPGSVSAHQFAFNTGSNTQITIGVQQYASDGTTTDGNIYYDDFVLLKKAAAPSGNTTPSNDGYITNGDFETGDLTGWTVSKGGEVVYDVVASGKFSLKGTAPSKYNHHVVQNVTVTANTDYVITFKAKLAQSGGQIRMVVNGNSTGTRLNDTYYFTSTTEWQTFQIAFNSGENTSVQVCPTQGVDNGGAIYYDDIKMEKANAGYQGLYPETMTSGADIRFMTYNVLCGKDEANGGYSWGTNIAGRPEKAFAMINYYKPDVIAFEEFSGEWYDAFVAQMTDYELCYMQSADTSKNNGKLYTCLAYNKNTIRLLDTDLFRNTVSRWGTQGMRYVNVGFFEVIATGEKFIGAATHPDAGKLVGDQDLNNDGVAGEGEGYWRQFQLEEAAAYVKGLSDEYKMPVVWGGDFNSGLENTYDDNISWYKVADAGFTDATNGRYIDHIWYNSMATHLYETTVADAAVSGASDHNAVFADIQFLDEFAITIKDAKNNIKTQGRTVLKDGALWLDFSASGIEFSANCEGKVALNLNVKSIKNTDATFGGIYFTVIVDGVKKDRAECRITETGNVTLVLADNLPAGNHTFEVYRQTEHRGAEVGISSITINGDLNAKPEDNRLYIEFIGDSISTGYGALGVAGNESADSPKWQDATVAYPYLVAKALDADFSDVAYSGLGCKYGYSGSLSMQTVYQAQRYQYDNNTKYGFNRKPDVVVIALGTNDIANQTDAALRKAGYQEMLDLVRAKNPDSKIVWIYGMMKDDDNAMIAELIEENGGGAAGLYSKELTTNTSGAGWHPSAAAQQVFADELLAFLNSDVLVKYVGDDMLDNDEGSVISYLGSSRMEMIEGETLGLAFLFKVNATGIAVKEGTIRTADLTNATIDAFGDGTQYKLVRMGSLLTIDPNKGLADLKLDDADGRKTLDINAEKLFTPETDTTQFAVRITNIPAAQDTRIVYARPYYVFEYEGREVVVYDDIQAQNYVNKYDSNDGVLEW